MSESRVAHVQQAVAEDILADTMEEFSQRLDELQEEGCTYRGIEKSQSDIGREVQNPMIPSLSC